MELILNERERYVSYSRVFNLKKKISPKTFGPQYVSAADRCIMLQQFSFIYRYKYFITLIKN